MVGTALYAAVTVNALGWVAALACLIALYSTGGFKWLGRSLLGLIAAYGYKPTRVLLVALILGGGLA
jgi:hypothetical protein